MGRSVNGMLDREKVIKGIQECDLNGGLIGNCPYKGILTLLKDQEPVDVEIEGGGSSWWYVCEECHGSVDRNDLFCRHCGRPFKMFKKKKCDGCSEDCPKVGNFVCPNGKL